MKEYLAPYLDIFNLCERIKKIDPNYELLFNKKTNRLEVHNFSERGSSLVTNVDNLDARLVDKLIKTRRENIKRFLEEMERENEKLEQEKLNSINEQAGLVLEEIAKYSFNKNRDLTDEEFKKILLN